MSEWLGRGGDVYCKVLELFPENSPPQEWQNECGVSRYASVCQWVADCVLNCVDNDRRACHFPNGFISIESQLCLERVKMRHWSTPASMRR